MPHATLGSAEGVLPAEVQVGIAGPDGDLTRSGVQQGTREFNDVQLDIADVAKALQQCHVGSLIECCRNCVRGPDGTVGGYRWD